MTRFKQFEDQTIVRLLNYLTLSELSEDLGRAPEEILLRVAQLRQTGAWDHFVDADAALRRALLAAGHITEEIAMLSQDDTDQKSMRTMHVIQGGKQ